MNHPKKLHINLGPIMQISAAAASAMTGFVLNLQRCFRMATVSAREWEREWERFAMKGMERDYRAAGRRVPGSNRTARLRKKREKAFQQWRTRQRRK